MDITLNSNEVMAGVAVVAYITRIEVRLWFQGRDHSKLEETVKSKDKLLWDKFDLMRIDISTILQNVSFLRGQSSREPINEKTT